MSEIFHNLAFMSFAGMTCLSALLVLLLRNILHAAVALFFALSGVAALYVLLGADFLGVSQLLIYAGGILVLIIFGVFLTSRIYETKVELPGKPLSLLFAIGVAAAIFGICAMVIMKTEWPQATPTYLATTKPLGEIFLTKYLLPFELISLLLLFAMVGSTILVKKEMGEKP